MILELVVFSIKSNAIPLVSYPLFYLLESFINRRKLYLNNFILNIIYKNVEIINMEFYR